MKTLLAMLVFAACGHSSGDIDNLVGTACSRDADCARQCYVGGAYPGGFCSVPCASDADCPGDTVCIDKSGGVCLFACPQFDCSRLGPGWRCNNKDLVSGGSENVCVGD